MAGFCVLMINQDCVNHRAKQLFSRAMREFLIL